MQYVSVMGASVITDGASVITDAPITVAPYIVIKHIDLCGGLSYTAAIPTYDYIRVVCVPLCSVQQSRQWVDGSWVSAC